MSNVVIPTVEAINRLIQDRLGPGDRLPSEEQLVRQLGVSRSTVRDALARLATDGVVEKRWGVGTFVAEGRTSTAFGMLSIRPGIPGILATTGGTPSVYRFGFTESPPDPQIFPDFPEALTLSLVRVFALDAVPVIAIRDRVVGEFEGRRLDPRPLLSVDTLVADVFAAVGVDFNSLEVDLFASHVGEEDRSLFDISRSEPVIETRARGLDAGGRQIVQARGIYRTRVVNLRLVVA